VQLLMVNDVFISQNGLDMATNCSHHPVMCGQVSHGAVVLSSCREGEEALAVSKDENDFAVLLSPC